MRNACRLAVCCLNVSEGRNEKIIELIANAATTNQSSWLKDRLVADDSNNETFKCKSTVLSVYADTVFNRGNITIAAPIAYLSQSVYQACCAAYKHIDLQDHVNPGHPRLGSVDLVPIHPISKNVSLVTCAVLAKEIAEMVCDTIEGTSFYYFGIVDKYNRGLIQRRKEMNWFGINGDVKNHPDIGVFNSTYGLTGIGAIPYMTVMNVLLSSTDLSVGQEIASKIRESNPASGLPGVQAMAFNKGNAIEIACNIDTNDLQESKQVFRTTFEELENAIKKLAADRGIDTVGQSLKGLSPKYAYDMAYDALLHGDTSPWKHRGLIIM